MGKDNVTGFRSIVSVVGARPNFMKLAPVQRALARYPEVQHAIVHTGQHYDREMSETLLRELGIPEPNYRLGVGSGTHAQQTAQVMQRLEPVLGASQADAVLVYGDVNSTVAAALVAAKLGIRVGHVEAGLRSRDRTMPEEINRVVTDRLADLLFTPSRDASQNLHAEGVSAERIHFVGNIMIDSLVYALPRAIELDAPRLYAVRPGEYAVVTLHRPSNVDDPVTLSELLAALQDLGREAPVLFPIHPRTRQRLAEFALHVEVDGPVRIIDPVGYLEMLSLVAGAALVITDSGGLQEETSYLGVPCLTVRSNTERPVTISEGTNRLVPSRHREIVDAAREVWGHRRQGGGIEFWDGQAAGRIVDILCR